VDALISSPTQVALDISPTYTEESGTVTPVDGTPGSGITDPRANGDVYTAILGSNNLSTRDVNGKTIGATPREILMHEIVGHVAPIMLGCDTGDAVSNESKTRAQIPTILQRAPDSNHVEGTSRAIQNCGLICTH
jgi:hypothetical protein